MMFFQFTMKKNAAKRERTHSNASPHSTHHAKVSTVKDLRKKSNTELLFSVSLQVCTCTSKNTLLKNVKGFSIGWFVLVIRMMDSFSHLLLNMTQCHFSDLELHGEIKYNGL